MPAAAMDPEPLFVLTLALMLEGAFGYPNPLYARIGHPVTWIGALIAWADDRMNAPAASSAARRTAGVVALTIVLAVTGAAAWTVSSLLHWLGGELAVFLIALAATSLLAQRSLWGHVAEVAARLRSDGLQSGRQAVSLIVGRNPATLDEAAVCRAAIESLAENFSDGVVAPAFWIAAGGLTGGTLYKAINTADSMIGHRTPRHEAFGWAAARLDDVVNLPASRLSALLVVTAAALQWDASPARAWRAVWRDAPKHRSPNAGWPEAAMAGALGLRLAGPRVYGATRVEDHWIGDGRAEATPADVDRALALYRKACFILWLLAASGAAAALL
jgi:adenosylcobinamide-phosphate synthase